MLAGEAINVELPPRASDVLTVAALQRLPEVPSGVCGLKLLVYAALSY